MLSEVIVTWSYIPLSFSHVVFQESAIVLAKLLLPQVFEKMPLQELRVLVAQRSVITTYIRGETIEVPHHSLGFLLEGFIKAHGFQELIASPAVLLPLQGNQSSQNIEISGNLCWICLKNNGWFVCFSFGKIAKQSVSFWCFCSAWNSQLLWSLGQPQGRRQTETYTLLNHQRNSPFSFLFFWFFWYTRDLEVL